MSIRYSPLQEHHQLIQTLDLLVSLAHMTLGCYLPALAIATGTCPLELLHEAWTQASGLGYLPLAITLPTDLHILGVIRP